MRTRKIAVLGAGTAGLATALILARDGHAVTLVERDVVGASSPASAFTWKRDGISHFLQPHAFIPRGRRELMEHFPDVHASLMREGAHDVDVRRKLPGPAEPGDEVLQYMGVRRPLIEWGLRQAALSQPGIEILSGAAARGVRVEGSTIRGVEWDGRAVEADIVVDAMGRRSPMRGWLEAQGHALAAPRTSQCGVIYYARYFRVRPGIALPDGPWVLGPRGDLGYMSFTTFPGDNDTFAVVLGVPTGVAELKVLMHEGAFQAAIGSLPAVMQWAAPGLVEPITGVLPMGGMQNSLGDLQGPLPNGLFPVADALCHTDPVLAHGLSFSLIHALEVGRALREHADPLDALDTYRAAVLPTLEERFELATALDDQRLRMWTGEAVDFAHRRGAYALFSMSAAGAVALVDPEVFRVFIRRMGLLDSTRVLDQDEPLQRRIEQRFADLMAQPRPAPGPAREEMLALARAGAGLS
jgi:2-polyprenyl-6-methoxyphenol hydroxylase-like FAD-dependent oxidoreductase